MSELRDSGIWTLEGTWKVLWKEFVRFSFFPEVEVGSECPLGQENGLDQGQCSTGLDTWQRLFRSRFTGTHGTHQARKTL